MTITASERTDLIKVAVGLFNAAPGATYLSAFVPFAGNSDGLVSALVADPAFTAIYPNYLTSAEFAAKFVNTLVGSATVDSAVEQNAKDWIAGRLDAGESRAAVLADVLAQLDGVANDDATWGQVATQFHNKVAVAEYYSVTQAGTSTSLTTLQNVIKAVDAATDVSTDAALAAAVAAGNVETNVGQTYTLTTGVDAIPGTSGNDTINAIQTTTTGAVLGGLDVVDGAAGTDTLNVQDTFTVATNAFTFGGATVKNVETLNVSTSGGFLNLDLSAQTALANATLTANGTGASTGIKLASGTSATIASATTGTNISVAAGGKALNITGVGAATIDVGAAGAGNINTSATSLTLKTGAGTVKAYGSALTDVTVNGGGAVTVDNTNATATSGAGTSLTSVTLNNDAGASLSGKGLTTVTLSTQGAGGVAQTVGITNGTVNHALTVNAAGTGYKTDGTKTSTVVTDAGATSLTVNTTTKSALDLSGSTSVTKLTLTGAGALDLSIGGAAKVAASVTTIDGSAATGDVTLGSLNSAVASVKTGAGNDSFAVANSSAKVTVDAGAGNDSVTLSAVLASGSTIQLGAGNDKLLGVAASAPATSTTTVIDGGDGTDTVSADLINAGNAALFKNFEALSLNSNTGLDLDLLTGSTIAALTMDTASTTATYQNVTATGLTDTYVGDNSLKTNTLQLKNVSGTTDGFTVTFAAADAATAAGSADVLAGTIVAAGIENFNIVSGGANHWNSVKLGADTSANTVAITGASNLDLTFAAGFGSTTAPKTGVSSIDGSAATGKLNVNAAGVVAATAGLTIKGGSADDTINTATQTGVVNIETGAGNDNVTLGAGTNTVNLGAGNDTVTTSTTASTLTGGAGADTFVLTATVTGATAAGTPVLTTITDAGSGDVLTFTAGGTNVFTSAKVDVSTATALFGGTVNALDLAVSADGSTNNQITWFQYGGNTYVVDHAGATTDLAATDVVVKLTGLIDLSTATFAEGGAAASTLTLA